MSALAESRAAERLASAIGVHLQPKWLTNAALTDICKKIVAHRGFFRSVMDDLDADPTRLPERGLVLRQQGTQQFSDEDHWAEHVAHLRRELADAEAIWERVRQAAHVDRYDPDAVAQDREDTRTKEQRQDEHAAREAVRP